MNRTALACTTIATLGVITAALVTAGPLNPPAGPVASSYKTLTDVEPRIAINAANTPGDIDSVFLISRAGSYYLVENLRGQPGKHGIEIAADNVTIDLMGFELTGVPGSLDGVHASLSGGPVDFGHTVRNGTATGWGGDGFDLTISTGGSCDRLIASANSGAGIIAPIGGVITACVARANGAGGIFGSSVLRDCAASNNTGNGFTTSGTVENCRAGVNTGSGFFAVGGAQLHNCRSEGNTLHGFDMQDVGSASHCDASQNTGSGFALTDGAAAIKCSGSRNSMDGFALDMRSAVRESTAWFNGANGIRAVSSCMIVANHCVSNGTASADGAGIRLTGSDNRVEANNVTDNDHGIVATAPNNFIVANTASSSGGGFNYDLVLGNAYGQIFNAPGAQAVQGSSSPVNGVNSTNPWANFSY